MQLKIQMWTSQWKWDWIGQILIMCGIDNSLLVSMDGQNKIRENTVTVNERERERECVCYDNRILFRKVTKSLYSIHQLSCVRTPTLKHCEKNERTIERKNRIYFCGRCISIYVCACVLTCIHSYKRQRF